MVHKKLKLTCKFNMSENRLGITRLKTLRYASKKNKIRASETLFSSEVLKQLGEDQCVNCNYCEYKVCRPSLLYSVHMYRCTEVVLLVLYES